MQVVTSLLVSALLLGFKLNVPKELTQTTQRRKELKTNLSLLQTRLDDEALAALLEDLAHDAAKRQESIAEMASADHVYSQMENEAIEKCLGMFAMFKSSVAKVTRLKHSVSTSRLETKQDEATGLLLGRAEAKIRAAPQEIVAKMLHHWSSRAAAERGKSFATTLVRGEHLETVNAHHTKVFARYAAARGMSDRTFLMSVVAKQLAEAPPTYVVAIVPIPRHDKIGPKDEAGAVRAENCRAYRLTEVAPGVTRGEYACSLDLKGWVPQLLTDKIVVPQQSARARVHVCVRPLACV
jgi:hypothetical protein